MVLIKSYGFTSSFKFRNFIEKLSIQSLQRSLHII